MFEFFSEKHREGVISLWNKTFKDSREMIENYLDNMCKNNMVLITEEDRVIAMASILPVTIRDKKGRYVYAVATDENYRGKGYGKAIMDEIDKIIKERDEHFAVLVPASESLFDFYEKLGYKQTVFAPPETKIQEDGDQIGPEEYFKIRDEILKDLDYVKWSKKDLEYILSFGEIRKINGGAVYIENGKVVENLTKEIFKEEWTKPLALIKYINCEEFKKPYFGLAMN
ncbi:MAG: GNAT family N-acetyltransferase [Clostridia bacterium]|nr:GNAT family N-acetyltransferase [Clostridia bacterium]